MRDDNPDQEVPAQRLQAVAAILAGGALRYCSMARTAAISPVQESSDSGQNALGCVRNTRLSVPTGSGGYDRREPEKGPRA